MTGLRLYAAATGACIVGEPDTADGNEWTRVESDFYSGVRLVVSREHNEIRGFVPARRTVDEAFVAVVDISDATAPLGMFQSELERVFEEHCSWEIRDDTPEGQLLHSLGQAGNATVSFDIGEVVERRSAAKPAYIGVSDLTIAGKLLTILCNREGELPTAAIGVGGSDIKHVEYDVLYLQRDQDAPAVELSFEESPDSSTDLLDWMSVVRNLWE